MTSTKRRSYAMQNWLNSAMCKPRRSQKLRCHKALAWYHKLQTPNWTGMNSLPEYLALLLGSISLPLGPEVFHSAWATMAGVGSDIRNTSKSIHLAVSGASHQNFTEPFLGVRLKATTNQPSRWHTLSNPKCAQTRGKVNLFKIPGVPAMWAWVIPSHHMHLEMKE